MRRLIVAILVILAFEPHVQAQDRKVELTAAGKAILEANLASDGLRLRDAHVDRLGIDLETGRTRRT